MKRKRKKANIRGNDTPITDHKLSLEHCRKVLNRNGNKYTDEEILEIRDFIEVMAYLDYSFFTGKYRKSK